MEILLDAALALLASIGIAALGWRISGRILFPQRDRALWAVVPARGGGDGLEEALRGVLWLRSGTGGRWPVVIADCGLDESGRRLAQDLTGLAPHMWLEDGFGSSIKESQRWTRKSSKI